MVWSTYFGGWDREVCTGVVGAPNGHYYAVGWTWSDDFVDAANFSLRGASDCFLIEFDPAHNKRSILCVFGGNDTDIATDVAIDETGRIYVAGYTFSGDFPVVNSLGGHLPVDKADCFIAVFSAAGVMEYSTTIGGIESDYATTLLVDAEGFVYLSGHSESPDFPIVPEFYYPHDGYSVDVVHLCVDWRNDTIRYSLRTGGTGGDYTVDSVIDNQGNVWIAGCSDSLDFPMNGHQIGIAGQSDCILIVVSSAGHVVDSYRIGGSGNDCGQGVVIDETGHLFLTGDTRSLDFPLTAGAYDTELSGDSDAFVMRIDAGQASVDYSTLLGGSDHEEARGIVVDDRGHVYVTGTTRSQDFVPDDSHSGLSDCYVIKMNELGTSIMYSTLVGGSSTDEPESLAIDSGGSVLVVGVTLSSDFPIMNATDSTFNGGQTDCFVFQLRDTSDSDFDGLPDFEEVAIGTDRHDNDTDEDGLEDGYEYYILGTNPLASDTDGDGMPDAWEIANGLNATLDDSDDNPDSDGLSNYEEYVEGTDPRDADSDGDRLTDGWEVAHGYNPCDSFVPVWEVLEAHASGILTVGVSVSVVFAVLSLWAVKNRRNERNKPDSLTEESRRVLRNLQSGDDVTEHPD